jgi:hypothetical protein
MKDCDFKVKAESKSLAEIDQKALLLSRWCAKEVKHLHGLRKMVCWFLDCEVRVVVWQER